MTRHGYTNETQLSAAIIRRQQLRQILTDAQVLALLPSNGRQGSQNAIHLKECCMTGCTRVAPGGTSGYCTMHLIALFRAGELDIDYRGVHKVDVSEVSPRSRVQQTDVSQISPKPRAAQTDSSQISPMARTQNVRFGNYAQCEKIPEITTQFSLDLRENDNIPTNPVTNGDMFRGSRPCVRGQPQTDSPLRTERLSLEETGHSSFYREDKRDIAAQTESGSFCDSTQGFCGNTSYSFHKQSDSPSFSCTIQFQFGQDLCIAEKIEPNMIRVVVA